MMSIFYLDLSFGNGLGCFVSFILIYRWMALLSLSLFSDWLVGFDPLPDD